MYISKNLKDSKLISIVVALLILLLSTGCETSKTASVWDYKLSGKGYNEFRRINEEFMRNEYRKLLKKNNLKLKCSECEYVYIIVELLIGADGKIKKISHINSNICGKRAEKELVKSFVQYYWKQTYIKEVRNRTIKVRIGTGLKC